MENIDSIILTQQTKYVNRIIITFSIIYLPDLPDIRCFFVFVVLFNFGLLG
jgi:hypothetical protein